MVAVGLRDPGHADALLGVAFAAAAARGSSLRVVHAWALPNPYADAVELRTHGPVWDEAARTMAAGVLEEWRRAYPMVPVTVEVVHDDPAQALVKASADADLLVVLRRKLPVLGPHLGRVGRAVLRSAACPVAVVPADEMLGLAAVEKAGTMLR
ncbi:universal stress protein [Nocardioides sp. TF02-7]|nr:universal stress protein [Nocardioides sp. TF02-7]UMG94866.1 universal stress protein [Nocardioides sp. TF02-7]